MPSACMAEIESHLIRCALPVQIPLTAFAGLALFNYNRYPKVCGLHRHLLRVLQRKPLLCACICHPELGLGGEKVRGQALFRCYRLR